MRRAKALAAERGESLKTLFMRAVSSELGRSKQAQKGEARVKLPLFGSSRKERIDVTNLDIARVLAADEAGTMGRRPRPPA
jgi:hypothetical protein